MWDRHDLDPFIVQEAKRPSAFQIRGTMQKKEKQASKQAHSKNPTTRATSQQETNNFFKDLSWLYYASINRFGQHFIP